MASGCGSLKIPFRKPIVNHIASYVCSYTELLFSHYRPSIIIGQKKLGSHKNYQIIWLDSLY